MRAIHDIRVARDRARLLPLTPLVDLDDAAVLAAWLRRQIETSRERRRRSVSVSLTTADLIDCALRELIAFRSEAQPSGEGTSRAS